MTKATVHKPRLYSYDEVLEIIGEDEENVFHNRGRIAPNYEFNVVRNALRAEQRQKLAGLKER